MSSCCGGCWRANPDSGIRRVARRLSGIGFCANMPLRPRFARGGAWRGCRPSWPALSDPQNRRVSNMKLQIERAALLKALGHVQSVVERRNTIPILSNVLLRGADGKLALSATDMDIEMVSTVPAQGVKTGGTTVPAHT